MKIYNKVNKFLKILLSINIFLDEKYLENNNNYKYKNYLIYKLLYVDINKIFYLFYKIIKTKIIYWV